MGNGVRKARMIGRESIFWHCYNNYSALEKLIIYRRIDLTSSSVNSFFVYTSPFETLPITLLALDVLSNLLVHLYVILIDIDHCRHELHPYPMMDDCECRC